MGGTRIKPRRIPDDVIGRGETNSGFKISYTPQEFIYTHYRLHFFVNFQTKIRENCILRVYTTLLMKLRNAYLLIAGLLILGSCKNDDDAIGEIVPPRLLSEVTEEDDAEIIEFLKTHFYNEDEFETPPEGFDFKIRFDTIAGENSTKRSIYDSPNLITQTITVDSEDLGREDDNEIIDQTLYTLVARQGVVEGKPTIGDFSVLR